MSDVFAGRFAVSPDIRYVAYGAFFQIVLPHDGGHVSVAVERSATPTDLVAPLRAALG